MAPVASQLIEEVTAHAQSDSQENARDICADGTYFPNNLHSYLKTHICFTLEVKMLKRLCRILKNFFFNLHGYTVHQGYQMLYCRTNVTIQILYKSEYAAVTLTSVPTRIIEQGL